METDRMRDRSAECPRGAMLRRRVRLWGLTVAMVAGVCNTALASNPPPSEDPQLPIIFVHGAAGSGAQYQTQAMRFASNGYPADRILAFEYPGTSPHDAGALDDFVDDVRTRFGVDKVHLVAHSMGTSVGSSLLDGYLTSWTRARKVAKYIGIDGFTSSSCPGSVPCMGIFVSSGRTLGSNNVYFPNQSHVEVVTSPESFVEQYKFLTGSAPTTTNITPMTSSVTISGRAVYFPANQGVSGAQLKIWQIDANSGHRLQSTPVAQFNIGTSGNWGPVQLNPQARYEMEVIHSGSRTYHFYSQPFVRSTDLVRLLMSEPDSELAQNTNVGDYHSTLVISRYKEWWSTKASGNDILRVSGTNIITSDIGNADIGIHAHDDAATPGATTLAPLSYFNDQAFQAGVDIYLPATTPPNGSISLVSYPRGDLQRPQTITVPNWASSQHAISVTFNDWVH